MHEKRILFIAITLAMVSNFEVDSVDTKDQMEYENRETLEIKDAQRHINSDPKPVKMAVVGLGNGGAGHGHGHLHHANKVGCNFSIL